MTDRGVNSERKSSPQNRQNNRRGKSQLHPAMIPCQFKPGQSGNPGGRPRTAKLSEACRDKLASIVPGDARDRTYAEAIADELARRALKGDIRATAELADRAEGRPGQNKTVTEEDKGIKVVVIDVPRPQRGVWMPDVGPGPLPNARPTFSKS